MYDSPLDEGHCHCEISFERLNGVDVRQVIMAENIDRRHMTKGQRAMAVAMIYPQAERGRGRKAQPQKAKKFWVFRNSF